MIQDTGMVENSHGARADYSGGSPNSLNGANLVKSHERAVYCVYYSCTDHHTHKHMYIKQTSTQCTYTRRE